MSFGFFEIKKKKKMICTIKQYDTLSPGLCLVYYRLLGAPQF